MLRLQHVVMFQIFAVYRLYFLQTETSDVSEVLHGDDSRRYLRFDSVGTFNKAVSNIRRCKEDRQVLGIGHVFFLSTFF